jgi:predicted RNA-binding Zn-ribbon protein involved in translation (DUF1610 family)
MKPSPRFKKARENVLRRMLMHHSPSHALAFQPIRDYLRSFRRSRPECSTCRQKMVRKTDGGFKCRKCGKEWPATLKFCAFCGKTNTIYDHFNILIRWWRVTQVEMVDLCYCAKCEPKIPGAMNPELLYEGVIPIKMEPKLKALSEKRYKRDKGVVVTYDEDLAKLNKILPPPKTPV